MFKRTVVLAVFVLLVFFLIGSNCNNDSNPTNPPDGDGTPDPSIYYPHVSGSWWIYTGGYYDYKLELGTGF